MYVSLDDLWCTPSTLHCRVTVHDSEGRWRHRYYPSLALDSIPEEAIAALLKYVPTVESDSRYEDLELF